MTINNSDTLTSGLKITKVGAKLCQTLKIAQNFKIAKVARSGHTACDVICVKAQSSHSQPCCPSHPSGRKIGRGRLLLKV